MSDDLFDILLGLHDEQPDKRKWAKAPFGWVGGKAESLKHIIPILDGLRDDAFIDVFAGSGVVTFNVRPPKKLHVYNDRYSGVVDFYRCLQSGKHKEVFDYVSQLMPPLSREQWIRAKAEWCTEGDPVVRAAKWYYMVRNSILCKGTSFARATNSIPPFRDPDLQLFQALHIQLKRIQIENLDWRMVFTDYDGPHAVFYLDPPYISTDQGAYKGSDCKFDVNDMTELLGRIERAQGTVCLSHYFDNWLNGQSFWDERYEWTIDSTSTPGERSQTKECMWVKYA